MDKHTTAAAKAEAGIAAALEHTERDALGWSDLALAFLHRHARRHFRFTSEQVADAGREWGLIEPASPKAWGAVYQRAQRLGIISKVGYGVAYRRHLSPCPLWQSNVYNGGCDALSR